MAYYYELVEQHVFTRLLLSVDKSVHNYEPAIRSNSGTLNLLHYSWNHWVIPIRNITFQLNMPKLLQTAYLTNITVYSNFKAKISLPHSGFWKSAMVLGKTLHFSFYTFIYTFSALFTFA